MSAPKLFFFKQAFNASAALSFLKIFAQPSLCVPSLTCKSLEQVPWNVLRRNGVKYIVFDKDNTLSLCYDDNLHESVKPALSVARKLFSTKGCAVLSNSVGCGDDEGDRGAQLVEKSFEIDVIRHKNKKPNCADEVFSFFR